MTQTKTTKRALLAAAVSLLVCLAMLIGSTFAWFTDTATTGVNKIAAGNLELGLRYSTDFVTWADAEDSTEIFDKDALWEPGYTEVVYFEVENKGNLALKYRVGTNLIKNVKGKNEAGNVIDLTDYIKFGIVPVTEKLADRAAALAKITDPIDFANLFVSENSLDAKGDKAIFAMVVFMPTSVKNEANHNGTDIPSIEFGVQVVATQKAYESDSYNNTYDANATYPNFAFAKYTEAEDVVLKGGNFEAVVPAAAELQTESGEEVAKGTEIVMNIDEADELESNITIGAGDKIVPYTITFETSDGEKLVATGEPITVKMDIGAGRTGDIKLYHYDDEITYTDYNSATGILTFEASDFSPYTVVEVGAITADTSWYNDTDTEFALSDAGDMFGLAELVDGGNTFAGKTVSLKNDIDLQYAEFEAIGDMNNPFSGNLNGNGKTISNLKITKTDWGESTGAAGKASENRQALISTYAPSGECVIKDLTINNASVVGCRGVGVLIAKSAGGNFTTNTLTVTNIKITGDVKVECQYEAAAVIGSTDALKELSNITVDVSADSYISNLKNGTTGRAMCIGSVGGWIKVSKADNIVSNMNVLGRDGCIGGIFGEVLGQSTVSYLSNLSYSGKVTAVDYDNQHKIQGSIVSFTKYFNGLLVGMPRYSVVADEETCTSTGSLELKMLDGSVLTTNYMGEWYEEWAVDLFGGGYDTGVSDYAKKSFSKNYAG